MPEQRPGGDDFFAPRAAVFNPGNARPFEVPRTEAAPRRQGRDPIRTIISWAVFLVVVAIAAKYGYPVVVDKLHSKERAALVEDLRAVGGAEDTYHGVYGGYTNDLAALAIAATVNHVDIVSASVSTYCLRGTSLTGKQVMYYSSHDGVSELACG